MGKHQRLDNGNLLLTEAARGRALEVDSEGRLVWEYVNVVDDGIAGVLAEAIRLPPNFDPEFFERARSGTP